MSDTRILDRNLAALSTGHQGLVSRLSRTEPASDLSFLTARSGAAVPVLQRKGRRFPMHSRFDPASEGEKLASGAGEGYLVVFGLGGAFHLFPLLERRSVTGLMIVEKDIALLRGLLEHIDLRNLFLDSRVLILVDSTPEELTRALLDCYLPVIYGNFAGLTLRPRWDADREWFAARAEALGDWLESLKRDYTVQTRFGRRWFVHTLANLARSEEVNAVIRPAGRLLITGAGPSLEEQLPKIRTLRKAGAFLAATDTSLPALRAASIPPDAVISIDCQVISFHHFLKGLPRETVLILDLASPPVLARLTDRVLFFTSAHPFSLYLNKLYRPFPLIDLSGGNVTHAAVSLAEAAGAREVHLFGADFSYPLGRPYAAGTYIFPYFHSRSTRITSAESDFRSFIANSHPRRENSGGGWRWRTALMDHYRDSLEKSVNRLNCTFTHEPGDGPRVNQSPRPPRPNGERIPSILSGGPVKTGRRDFIGDYRRRLEELPRFSGSPRDYLAGLSPENRQVWATLLPQAAGFREKCIDGPSAVEQARDWTIKRIIISENRRGDPSRSS